MICTACGTEYPQNQPLPAICPICSDDRQYIPVTGQNWISREELGAKSQIRIQQLAPGLHSLKVQPNFAIVNRALLIQSPGGNILWDCIPGLDDATISFIRKMGGIKAIAISHPHYYSLMNEWAEVFDCPVYIHVNDSEWVMNKGPYVQLWKGEQLAFWDGINVIHTGGHFPGSCLLQWQETLLTGDTLYIAPSRQHMAVMHSYPNQILLHRDAFAAFDRKTAGLVFDAAYGAFDNQDISMGAMHIFRRSMQRYKDNYGL